MKKVKTWTINTYERRCNHTLVAPDLLNKSEEMSLEEMHTRMDEMAKFAPKVFPNFYYNSRYELYVTREDGRNFIFRPMPATYEEVN